MPLHPVIERMFQAQRDAGRLAPGSMSVADARAWMAAGRAALGRGPEIARNEEIEIKGRSGVIPARLLRPAEPAGLIVYLHGGGWVLGEVADFDTLARILVARSGCALLLVDYRLAPEHPFPAGLEDTEDAVFWAVGPEASALGLGGLPIVLAGDSAGGNLAAVAALALRGRVEVALQVLFYPVTDTAMTTESYRLFEAGYPLREKDMRWFLRHYAPDHAWDDPRIAPLREPDLRGAPPAWIGTAEFDVLRDEAEDFARRLSGSGVAVVLRRFDGLAHGYARITNLVDAADDAVSEAARAIKQAVSPDR